MTWLMWYALHRAVLEDHPEVIFNWSKMQDHGQWCPCNSSTLQAMLVAILHSGANEDASCYIKNPTWDIACYLRDHLSPIISTQPMWSGKIGTLWVSSIKQCHLLGPQKHIFTQAFVEGDWSPLFFCTTPVLSILSLLLFFLFSCFWIVLIFVNCPESLELGGRVSE